MNLNLIVIPLRANSKRLKSKNIRLFNGIPLLEYTINFAINCTKNTEILVCTDCEISKQIAIQYGLEVIDRPYEISHDLAKTSNVIKYVLEKKTKQNKIYNSIITLQVTNPLRPRNLFYEAIEIFNNTTMKDSVISVTSNEKKIGKIHKGYFSPLNYNLGERSQDIPKTYYENGLIYISNPNIILHTSNLFGEKIIPIIVDNKLCNADIDTLDDFESAENLLINNISYFKHLLKKINE
jgi:CMP-N-acetylneuraminic acid synthetase